MSNELRTYFYLLEGEQQPPNAPNDWFLGVDNSFRTLEEIETFENHATLLLSDIAQLETEEEFQAAFYSRAKLAFGDDNSSIRKFFVLLYLLMFGRDSGPRWGQFVKLTGREEFISKLKIRLESPMS